MTTPKHIVVATDLSEASVAALREAGEQALQHAARLTVLHAYDPTPWVPPAMVPNPARAYASISAEMKEAIEGGLERRCQESLPEGLQNVKRVAHESTGPARGVCDYAKEAGADLLIVGTHGRTGVGRALLGSVAEQIVRHAPCNVMVVRSE